ncbi:hypothetical protein [Nocardia cyriacigeorgica]|uniref:hypothetical protein n=1 Tax=Nocardia cyriacigeorgica TaxID=135487 RepID=UPI001894F73D|nr:hypothetical protein [Nocardia cyriacigeorgica]MBF6439625.1 hypothetical protein [Nocardia cyriacigeorgica]
MTVFWNDTIEALWAQYLRQDANAGAAVDNWDPEDPAATLGYMRQTAIARTALVEHLREVGAVTDLSDEDRTELLTRLTTVAAETTVQSSQDSVPGHLESIIRSASRP